MKKVINFINRTKESILTAFGNLRKRYRKVEFVYKMEKGLFNGYFIVEGYGIRYTKWN